MDKLGRVYWGSDCTLFFLLHYPKNPVNFFYYRIVVGKSP
jgi:hypothetical protein